jgi:2,3-dihydroxy-p-cumate/2,3-dihydroxybenzoate 3,4-dioxygenase
MQMGEEYEPKVTKIARLGHVVVTTSRFDSALKFFTDVMNFRVSDYIGEGFAFMRCFPNPYHHSFALSSGKENKLHHVNFMVTDIDDIGIARNRMLSNDVPIVFGPGRHAPSDSIFLYFLDPDGMTVEYSFGMEEFPDSNPRKPRILEPSLNILDTWGGKPESRMGSVGKIG